MHAYTIYRQAKIGQQASSSSTAGRAGTAARVGSTARKGSRPIIGSKSYRKLPASPCLCGIFSQGLGKPVTAGFLVFSVSTSTGFGKARPGQVWENL